MLEAKALVIKLEIERLVIIDSSGHRRETLKTKKSAINAYVVFRDASAATAALELFAYLSLEFSSCDD
jgi:hypothetical protein